MCKGLFSWTHKNKHDHRKIEVARLQELNSNSFEYNSNGFEFGLGLVWPKMLRILVELGKMVKEFMGEV